MFSFEKDTSFMFTELRMNPNYAGNGDRKKRMGGFVYF